MTLMNREQSAVKRSALVVVTMLFLLLPACSGHDATPTVTLPPEDVGEYRDVSFERAQELVSFDLIKPDPLPKQLQFTDAYVYLGPQLNWGGDDTARLHYRVVDGEKSGGQIEFIQRGSLSTIGHPDEHAITIDGKSVTTFKTLKHEEKPPLAVYFWTTGDRDTGLGRSYTIQARLGGGVTEQLLEDFITALP